jgi:hypothetical protein
LLENGRVLPKQILFDHCEALTLKSLNKLWIGCIGTDLLVMS